MNDTTNSEGTTTPEVGPQLPEFVDWIAATVIALIGVALTVGGTALAFAVDRDLLESGVESGQITVIVFERDLTEAEMLEFTQEIVTWTGWGLLVTGIGLVLFAIGYVVVRHRAYRQLPDDESAGSYLSSAVLGALVTGILSFLPFSPVFGGGAAGYLERYGSGRTVSAGALSGFLAIIPALVILVFVTIGLYIGLAAVQYSGLGIVAGAAMLFGVLFTGAYGTAFGALGGFAGGRLAE
ncbi:DUF5518 domain-containing protein [Natronoarchaeum sp. GCM10025703]|uniref:DUF5518 domain-containing protein n=1 Tax=unclassified Natronoarchaeum TaxID=2620183 RepID=UPI00361C8552